MVEVPYFLIAFFVSALGTIPIGLITLTIAQRTIEKGESAGWQVALGATIIEFFYTFLAFYGLEFFSINHAWKQYIQIGATFLFFLLGAFYWTKKSSIRSSHSSNNKQIYFLQGIGVGIMNMLIIPFWLVVGVWLESNDFILKTKSDISLFSFGAALGALLVFIGYIKGSAFIIKKSARVEKLANKVVGSLFFVLSIIQLVQALFNL